MLEHERQRTGESMRQVSNRLLRCGLQGAAAERDIELPVLAGRPRVDIADVSAVLADEEDETLTTRQAF